ncbi:MAG TPA: ArsC family (seleno)protein [Candidatus Polarisedimenticolia bacterium]|jgi:arsenate reductase-like glutaredoxin family protein
MTCGRAREFLERKKIKVTEQVAAGKASYGKKEALALAAGASRLVSAKGTRVVELDLKAGATDSEILALMLGPTGNLRAPTMRVGDTLYVGFPKEGFPALK